MEFSSLLWIFFPACHCVYPFSSLNDPWCFLQTPCVWADFSCLLWIFPVIHSCACVHHSSMFRVVDVLCAVSIQLVRMNGFFPLCYRFFPCVSWSTPCSSFKRTGYSGAKQSPSMGHFTNIIQMEMRV